MNLVDEIRKFDLDLGFLVSEASNLAPLEPENATAGNLLTAEMIAFRLFRSYERFIKCVFLDSCVSATTVTGRPIKSQLKATSHDSAESILKAGRPFLDWGNLNYTKEVSNLVFEQGFPVLEMVGPLHSDLVDLQRIRNFIAHESQEALLNFEKVVANHLNPGATVRSAGALLLSRRRPEEQNVLGKMLGKIGKISEVYVSL